MHLVPDLPDVPLVSDTGVWLYQSVNCMLWSPYFGTLASAASIGIITEVADRYGVAPGLLLGESIPLDW